MPLKVLPCITQDFPRAVEVEKAAWADDPFTSILFPGPFPEGMAEFRAQEMARQLDDDPTTRWLKVVDTDSAQPDQGIAFANWHVYEDSVPKPSASRTFGEGCNAEACESVFGGLARQRERWIGDMACVYLQILITDPAHGRRGAGGLLIRWGINEASKYKLPLYVESSRKGHKLYKRYGFKDIEFHETDLSKFGATDMHQTWAMMIKPEGC